MYHSLWFGSLACDQSSSSFESKPQYQIRKKDSRSYSSDFFEDGIVFLKFFEKGFILKNVSWPLPVDPSFSNILIFLLFYEILRESPNEICMIRISPFRSKKWCYNKIYIRKLINVVKFRLFWTIETIYRTSITFSFIFIKNKNIIQKFPWKEFLSLHLYVLIWT